MCEVYRMNFPRTWVLYKGGNEVLQPRPSAIEPPSERFFHSWIRARTSKDHQSEQRCATERGRTESPVELRSGWTLMAYATDIDRMLRGAVAPRKTRMSLAETQGMRWARTATAMCIRIKRPVRNPLNLLTTHIVAAASPRRRMNRVASIGR